SVGTQQSRRSSGRRSQQWRTWQWTGRMEVESASPASWSSDWRLPTADWREAATAPVESREERWVI
ncbi:Hypothetical predicted protein, partial [Olea europaea subsp. europaea]